MLSGWGGLSRKGSIEGRKLTIRVNFATIDCNYLNRSLDNYTKFWGTSIDFAPPKLGVGGPIRTVLRVDLSVGLENETQQPFQFSRRLTLAKLLPWRIDPHKIFTA
jgi:hypothetical protein